MRVARAAAWLTIGAIACVSYAARRGDTRAAAVEREPPRVEASVTAPAPMPARVAVPVPALPLVPPAPVKAEDVYHARLRERLATAWPTFVAAAHLTAEQEAAARVVLTDVQSEAKAVTDELDDMRNGREPMPWPAGARTPAEAQRMIHPVIMQRLNDASAMSRKAYDDLDEELTRRMGEVLTAEQVEVFGDSPLSDVFDLGHADSIPL